MSSLDQRSKEFSFLTFWWGTCWRCFKSDVGSNKKTFWLILKWSMNKICCYEINHLLMPWIIMRWKFFFLENLFPTSSMYKWLTFSDWYKEKLIFGLIEEQSHPGCRGGGLNALSCQSAPEYDTNLLLASSSALPSECECADVCVLQCSHKKLL